MRLLILLTCAFAVFSLLPPARAQVESPDAPTSEPALDPASVVVLPVDILTTEPGFEPIAAALRAELVSLVSAIDGLNVVDADSVRAYLGSGLEPEDVARRLGAGIVIESGVLKGEHGYHQRYAYINVDDGSHFVSGSTYARESWDPANGLTEDVRAQMADAAASFADVLRADGAAQQRHDARRRVARERFLDTSLSEQARVKALNNLRPPVILSFQPQYADGGESLTGEVTLAAIELARASDDPDKRALLWNIMAGVQDPNLTQPLKDALSDDPDAVVRSAAARALGTRSGLPGVADALRWAAANDTDAQVRDAAIVAVGTTQEVRGTLRSKVMDSGLDSWQRRRALYDLGRLHDEVPSPADAELAESLADWAQAEQDRRLRKTVWMYMGSLGGSYAVEPLLDGLKSEPDETIRESIVNSLFAVIDQPGVRNALIEAATEDPSPLIRKEALWGLERY